MRATIGLIVFLGAWTLLVNLLAVPEYLVPSPLALAHEFWFLLTEGNLMSHVPVTVIEIVTGFVAGSLLGVIFAVAFTRAPWLELLLSPLIVLIQTAPKISIAPLLLLWLGLGLAPKIVLVIIVTFFPVMSNVHGGLKGIDPRLHDFARIVRMPAWMKFRRVELPHCLPSLFAGMKIAATLSVTAAVIGELMGARAGLGYLLRLGQETADVGIVMVAVILLSIIGFVFYLAIEWAERRLLAWHESGARLRAE
ncbi:MAG: ABC transporter permease [Azospirillaceae bacterium]